MVINSIVEFLHIFSFNKTNNWALVWTTKNRAKWEDKIEKEDLRQKKIEQVESYIFKDLFINLFKILHDLLLIKIFSVHILIYI